MARGYRAGVLDRYRQVLSRPGAAAFCASGLVGRLPISMIGLGIVLLVSSRSGSYSEAGTVSAAYVLANAVFSILEGRLIDRLGQGRFLPPTVAVFAVATALLAWSAQAGWPLGVSLVLAAVGGAALPPVGSCVRARWAHVLDDPRDIDTAYSLEAVVDEAVFIVGPTLVTLLATAVQPVAGLATGLVAGTAGTLALARQHGTEPPARGPVRHQTGGRTRLPWRVMGPLGVLCVTLGVFFGAAEVTTVAVSAHLGHRAYAGPLLALWAFGSLLAGLVSGGVTWRRSTVSRVRIGMVALTVLMAPLALLGSFWLLGVMLFLAGFAISPTMIAALSLAEQVLPRARLTEGMAVLQTGIATGLAVGAPVAGAVIDRVGPSAGYLVTVAGGALGALAAQLLPSGDTGGRDSGATGLTAGTSGSAASSAPARDLS